MNAKISLVLAVVLLLCSCESRAAVSDSSAHVESSFCQQNVHANDVVSEETDSGECFQAVEVNPDTEMYRTIIGYYWRIAHYDGDYSDAVNHLIDDLGDEVKNIDNDLLQDDLTYTLWYSCADLLSQWIPGDLGYAIADLNNDGVPELIILSEKEYFVHAIYSYSGDGPVLISGYWLRNRCVINEDGVIIANASSGAADSSAASYDLQMQMMRLCPKRRKKH